MITIITNTTNIKYQILQLSLQLILYIHLYYTIIAVLQPSNDTSTVSLQVIVIPLTTSNTPYIFTFAIILYRIFAYSINSYYPSWSNWKEKREGRKEREREWKKISLKMEDKKRKYIRKNVRNYTYISYSIYSYYSSSNWKELYT